MVKKNLNSRCKNTSDAHIPNEIDTDAFQKENNTQLEHKNYQGNKIKARKQNQMQK